MKRCRGISKKSTFHSFKGGVLTSQVHSAAKQHARKHQAAEKRASAIKEMSSEDRVLVQEMDTQHPPHEHQELYDAAFNSMPPGEEGFDLSHAGGEHEVFEEFAQGLGGPKRTDHRDRHNRTELRNAQWAEQYQDLVDAYLMYSLHEQQGLVPDGMEVEGEGNEFLMEVVDIFGRETRTFMPLPTEIYHNATLVRNGYIGASPIHPTVAISIRTLSVYRQTHRVCPQLSIQAEVRKLCHLHKVPYHRYLCEQFTVAYDVYLEICYRVDARIRTAFKQDQRDAQLLNACPACTYKLRGEPELDFSLHCEMDGNNSLKRIDAAVRERRERIDTRRPRGAFWVSQEEVNRFKDDVKRSPGNSKDAAEDDSADHDTEDDWHDEPGSEDPVATCIERWRNAGPEQRKQMFALFEESGIFVMACRHGTVLLVCDMIQSGELAKYGLAVVNRAMDAFGQKLMIGYDIGCAFEGTVSRSSLGSKAKQHGIRFVVGAFHGHAHNRGCQLRWHPQYVKGTGRSDFEGCERVFASSNAIASGTRHASRFHRHQAIDEHLMFWNSDKYALLTNYIVNHYREALHIIETHPEEIQQMLAQLSLTEDECHAFVKHEQEYLRGLKKEPPEESLKFMYLEALEDLDERREHLEKARQRHKYLMTTPALPNLHKSLVNASRDIRSSQTKYINAETTASQLEAALQVRERWTADTPEFKEVQSQVRERKYKKALDELERLVVQRLFELSKLNMSGTGYKLRQQITKALQRRSMAIQNALKKYNSLARMHSPPRPQLSWNEIVEYTFLGEFELLRHSRTDIRNAAWAQPTQREVTLKVLKLERAREEIQRLDVEAMRLRTFIRDEAETTSACLMQLDETDPGLAMEVRKRWELRNSVNALHLTRLDRLCALPGCSIPREAGPHVAVIAGTSVVHMSEQASTEAIVAEVLAGEGGSMDAEDDDDVSRDLESITTWVEGVAD